MCNNRKKHYKFYKLFDENKYFQTNKNIFEHRQHTLIISTKRSLFVRKFDLQQTNFIQSGMSFSNDQSNTTRERGKGKV